MATVRPPMDRRSEARPVSRLLRAAALAAVVPLVLGCDSTAPDTGRLSILLTDAPGDIRAAVVTISQVYLQGSDGDADAPGGRVVVGTTETTTDLLTLASTTRTLVDEAEIPAGHYGQLRFVVTGGYIEVENPDGSTSIYASSPDYAGLPEGAVVAGALQMPSYAQSGLKVTLPGGIDLGGGESETLLVDFDVAQSFGRDAGSWWVMHPVVQATTVEAPSTVD